MLFLFTSVTGRYATSLVTAWFTTNATDLRGCFLHSGSFNPIILLVFTKVFLGTTSSSTMKVAMLQVAVQSTFSAQMFVWMTQQSKNIMFSRDLYLNMSNILINWKAKSVFECFQIISARINIYELMLTEPWLVLEIIICYQHKDKGTTYRQ